MTESAGSQGLVSVRDVDKVFKRGSEEIHVLGGLDLQIPEGMSSPVTGSALLIAAPPMPPPAYAMETRPPRISSTTSGLDANSSFNWSSQGLYLSVDDTPESVHRRLGLVIERAGMQRVRLDDLGVVVPVVGDDAGL